MNACVTRLTPPGSAALASLGLWGPDSLVLLYRYFQPLSGRHPSFAVPPRPWLGRIDTSAVADEVVVLLAGTAELPRIEIFCHGNPVILDGLLALFRDAGAMVASLGDWFMVEQGELLGAEATTALTQCVTARTASHLLAQQGGALRREIPRMWALAQAGDWERLRTGLEFLLATAEFGRHLIEPWQVVLAGPVNAGKSSLLNALAGFDRAITSPEPGTTRDLVGTVIDLDGWPVEVTDTAGWRPEPTPLEAQGIAKMLEHCGAADLVLWLVEPGHEFVLPEVHQRARRFLMRRNKADLLPVGGLAATDVSATTGHGLVELHRDICRELLPQVPETDAPLLINDRQISLVKLALECTAHRDGQAVASALSEVLGPT